MLTLVQHGDTLNLIEERHLDSLHSACEFSIDNLEAQIKELEFQRNEYQGQAARWENIAGNNSQMFTECVKENEGLRQKLKWKDIEVWGMRGGTIALILLLIL